MAMLSISVILSPKDNTKKIVFAEVGIILAGDVLGGKNQAGFWALSV